MVFIICWLTTSSPTFDKWPYILKTEGHYFIPVKFYVDDKEGVLLVRWVHLDLVVT